MSSTGAPGYSRLHEHSATAVYDMASGVYFDLGSDTRTSHPIDHLNSTDDGNDPSTIPELLGWTGVALSRKPNSRTIHANVYSDIEPDMMGVADMDYLVLGVWLEVPDDVADKTSLAGVLVSGTDEFNSANIAGLTGSASYEGPTIGIYEERRKGSIEDIRIGSFIASANLQVDFDVSGLTIDGKIAGFEENGQVLGDSNGDGVSDWEVELNALTSGGGIFGTPIVSRAGVTYATGSWDATLYGNGQNSTDYPTSIAGSFWGEVGSRNPLAQNDDGYLGLVGAFGARRRP